VGKRREKEKGEKGKEKGEKGKRKIEKRKIRKKIEKGFRKLGEFLGKLGEGFLRIFFRVLGPKPPSYLTERPFQQFTAHYTPSSCQHRLQTFQPQKPHSLADRHRITATERRSTRQHR
jgi:hypothetical protein